MKSLCFACGREKLDALLVCSNCEVKPISEKDRIHSICLSDHCFNAETLEKASRFIREKRKLPKLGEKALAKAAQIVKVLAQAEKSPYTLMDVDDSFFDFDGFESDKGETVVVHSIGKGDGDEAPIGIAREKNTYTKIEWQVGKDISFEDLEKYSNDNGELHIQYTWRGDQGWIWKFVNQDQFEQVKSLEEI